MNYRQSLDYIHSRLPMFHRIGAAAYKADLGNIKELCRLNGNPQDCFKSVHIAGTNGKGSVSHMLASVLMESGLRTGLFTSPHLKDFRERIRVNGRMIPKRKVAQFIAEGMKSFTELQPSFFEMTTALGFEHFRDEQVDVAVIETGMGGRLDSTNVITPVLSVITNISFDHKQFLGETMEQIAGEKAGIIKPHVPVVIGETQSETESVFREKAAVLHAPLLFAGSLFNAEMTRLTGTERLLLKTVIREAGSANRLQIQSPLAGLYQVNNIITVMAAVRVLRTVGFKISDNHLADGIRRVIRNTHLQGRWQVIGRRPLIICDTGHNEGGLRQVVAQIATTKHDRLHVVFGAVDDKDLSLIFPILPRNALYYFCKPDVPRGLDAAELARQANTAGFKGNAYPSVKAAFDAARSASGPNDMVFVGGSTFVVAEVIRR